MEIISTIFIGLVVGLVARLVKPGRDAVGWIATCIIGVVGAFVGSFIGQATGMYAQGEAAGFLMSVLGAILVLFAYEKITSRGAIAHP